jgi:transcriptional regulator with XRE-family HTH domain
MNNAQTAYIIKKRCKEKGVSVKALLEVCKIRKGLIYDLEKRDKVPAVDLLEKIAICLDCSVDYLIGRTDNPKVNI